MPRGIPCCFHGVAEFVDGGCAQSATGDVEVAVPVLVVVTSCKDSGMVDGDGASLVALPAAAAIPSRSG